MTYKLNEIINSANTGADAIRRAPILNEETDLRCIRIGDISNNRPYVQWGYTKTTIEDYKRFKLHKGDCIIARTGNTIGVSKYIENEIEAVYNNGLIRISANRELIIPKYLYYIISSKDCQNHIQSIAYGTSTQPNMKIKELLEMEVNIPSLEIQDKIINIIDAIDKKIELNAEISNNLEQQAQALYEKFIYAHKTTEVSVSDIILTANTGADAIQKAPIVDEDTGIRCIRVGDMSNSRPVHEWGFAKVKPDVFEQYQLHKNDIVVTRTASLGLNRLISSDLNAVYNNGLIRLSIDDTQVLPLIVYRQFQTKDYENYIGRITGETSVRPNMKINYLLQYKFKIVSIDKQIELSSVLQPLFDEQEENILENQRLSELRDALLPKLMSGELDVSEIDI